MRILEKERNRRRKMGCICLPGDPCDYHAATCTLCPPGKCVGHQVEAQTNREPDALDPDAPIRHGSSTLDDPDPERQA